MQIILTRIAASMLIFFSMCHVAMGFFLPFTHEQKIAKSSVIAVIEVKHVNNEKGISQATVIDAVLGTKVGEKIDVWDDWQLGDGGKEHRIDGRDAHFELGKRYLVYLTKNERGRLVTVQSSLDCLVVKGDTVQKVGENASESLVDKLLSIRDILSKLPKAK